VGGQGVPVLETVGVIVPASVGDLLEQVPGRRVVAHPWDAPLRPCPIPGARWEWQDAARCGQTRSGTVIVAASVPLTCANVLEQESRRSDRRHPAQHGGAAGSLVGEPIGPFAELYSEGTLLIPRERVADDHASAVELPVSRAPLEVGGFEVLEEVADRQRATTRRSG
jgi:hypothetical protein